LFDAAEQHCAMAPCAKPYPVPADEDAAGRIAKQQKSASVEHGINPLSETGVLQRVLDYVGPGCWLLMSLVSKAWRESYLHVLQQQIKTEHDCVETGVEGEPRMTLLKAAVTSASVLKLACDCGLPLDSSTLQYIAGRRGDIATLSAAFERGMLRSSYVCKGAARGGCLAELRWLVLNQNCPVQASISVAAAASGSVPVLEFLKQRGIVFTVETAYSAAAAGHQHVIEYLHSVGCPFADKVSMLAAVRGHEHVVQRLRELECAWDNAQLCMLAASRGLLKVLQWAKQQGAAFTEEVMLQAAANGHTAVCEYLHAQQCPLRVTACYAAASGCQLGTLRWLLERGCPYDASALWGFAANGGHISVLEFLVQASVHVSPDPLSVALLMAGIKGHLAAAQWLRAYGAEWPHVLSASLAGALQQWPEPMIEWARAEGCTAPLQE
jgi:hypothetical protein